MTSIQTVPTQKLGKTQKLKGKKLTLAQLHKAQHPTVQKKTYILADISGSMGGVKLEALKDALEQVWRPGIHGLAFEDDIYDFEQKDIQRLPVRGGTNMYDALQAAWGDGVDYVILVTDGQPTSRSHHPEGDSKQIILNAARQHTSTPIDTIGISDGRESRWGYDEDFLRELSRITGGRFNSVDEPLLLSNVMEDLLQLQEGSGQAFNSRTIQL